MTGLKVFNTFAFIIMITVNFFANNLPLNKISTGAVSDSYPNLFAPAAVTFLIWLVIYFLLACFVIYQFGSAGGKKDELIQRIGPYFIISSFANAAWMFSWHYKNIVLSIVLMLIILICLAIIFIRIGNTNISHKEKIFVKLAFTIYFGWITVATIANLTVLFVSLGFDALGIAGQVWTIFAIILGMAIGGYIVLRERNVFYGLVIIWAYIGILVKHIHPSGFNGRYIPIIIITFIAIAILIATDIFVIIKNKELF